MDHNANPQRRQGGTETDQVLPDWMSYSAYSTDGAGAREYTVIILPQTIYGPSIPLGTDGVYTYGGLSSPAEDAAVATTPAVTTEASTVTDLITPQGPSTTSPTAPTSTLATESALPSGVVATPPPDTSTALPFLSTLSGASVRSTSLAEELTSAFSVLSVAEEASQSVESIFSQASSAVSVFSTGSTESTISTASVQSVSSVSETSASEASITSSQESVSSTASVMSVESVLSLASVSSTASVASVTSLASIFSLGLASERSIVSVTSIASVHSLGLASERSVALSSISTQSVASAASASSLAASPSLSSGSSSASGLPERSIIALAIGIFFAILLLLLIAVCLIRWRQRQSRSLVTQRRIPTDRSHSVHQSMFSGPSGGPSDGRVMVQGTLFDMWTPEQRAARERAQARRSVSSWAGRTLALITGTRGSRGSGSGSGGSRGSRGTRGTRRVSRTAEEQAIQQLEEETPLVGHQSPPLSPQPFSSPPIGPTDSLLPAVPLFAVHAHHGSSSSLDAMSHGQHSRNQSGATLPLSRPESPGDGEHETAELLVAQRATRSPSPKLGRLSWFQRMGLIGVGAPSTSSQEGEAGSDEPHLPDMSEVHTDGRASSSLGSWLEMGGAASSFPEPPPMAQPGSRGLWAPAAAADATRPISTVSTQSVYHDALAEQPSSRSGTPPLTTAPLPPPPSTPPSRRRPVPPLLGHHRSFGSGGSLLGSRTDLLDLPVPSPLRRTFGPGTPSPGSTSPPSAWRPYQPMNPDIDLADELPPPPVSAWRSTRGSTEDLRSSTERASGDDEERRPGSLRRFTFGYPALGEEPISPPRSRERHPGLPGALPRGAAPPSIRDSFHQTQFDTSSPRSRGEPSFGADTSYNSSLPQASTSLPSTPRSSVVASGRGLGLEDPTPMPTSAFGKPKTRGAWPSSGIESPTK